MNAGWILPVLIVVPIIFGGASLLFRSARAALRFCAGGTLGILIPPSVMIIVYGPIANISVGKLFLGTLVPGLCWP